ncbi:MAG: hypothetical protein KatS3mg118_0405 [Paracoccaceae bacterium]|nr:MAG: hypothetical protein KatS3mg118_0405 [Paracoccaceae bacterium]
MRHLLALSTLVAVAAAAPARAATDCVEMPAAAPADVRITAAIHADADDKIPVAHCLLRGIMSERTGIDGKPYALRFELRLPDDWQGRFLHQFNGGNDGVVRPALGAGTGIDPSRPALARGFAVVSSDAGHDARANPEAGLAGSNLFGFDFEARRDYGYAAVARLHPVALALTETYYGRPPQHVYGYGTSNGGRHALVAAARMPEAFDGLLAGYPGFNLPRAAIQHAWDVQTFRSVAPSLAEAFSREELALVAEAILAACDQRDGLADGVVFDVLGCQQVFDPGALACVEGRNGPCLPPEKVAALVRIHAGPRDSQGRQLYNSWFWDPGIASANWRSWKLESPVDAWGGKPIIAVMGAGSLAQIFTTPPTRVEGTPEALEAFLMRFDFDRDAPKIHATSADFPESAMAVMTPPDVDRPTLAGLEAAGGRLILFHGTADPVFSFKDTADWIARLRASNPDADSFLRFYAIPGMPHGRGGNAPYDVDFLDALIAWVEQGAAPGPLVGRFPEAEEVRPDNAGAERLLCPWPQLAVYTGGDPRTAASFVCR